MNLDELEARLQELIEIRLAGAFPGQKLEDLVAHKISAAMRANLIVQEDGSRLAPNTYTLIVNPASRSRWQDPQVLDSIMESLNTVSQEADLKFDAAPTITITTDASLSPGQVNLVASHEAKTMEDTQNMPNDSGEESLQDNTIPENAFLIIEGVKVFPLKDPVVNIGRRLDNTLVIDDPRVSRSHAQLRAINGRFVLFDLNSTGGTFVNGQRTGQSVLYPGDVISLAGVAIIFGQDNPPPRPDLANTSPFNEAGADRPTAILRTMPPTAKKKK